MTEAELNHEHIVELQAPQDRMLHLWFEPWDEGRIVKKSDDYESG